MKSFSVLYQKKPYLIISIFYQYFINLKKRYLASGLIGQSWIKIKSENNCLKILSFLLLVEKH